MNAEFYGFTAAYLLAAVLLVGALLVRRPDRRAAAPAGAAAPERGGGIVYLAVPLIALLASEAVARGMELTPRAAAWLHAHALHRESWFLFWTIVLGGALLEGVLRLVFALRRRNFPLPR